MLLWGCGLANVHPSNHAERYWSQIEWVYCHEITHLSNQDMGLPQTVYVIIKVVHCLTKHLLCALTGCVPGFLCTQSQIVDLCPLWLLVERCLCMICLGEVCAMVTQTADQHKSVGCL